MSVARVTEISSTSSESFEDAIKQGIDRDLASKVTKAIKGTKLKVQVAVQGTGSSPEIVREAIPRGALDYRLYAKEGIALLKLIHEAKITQIDTSPAIDKHFDYSLIMEATCGSRSARNHGVSRRCKADADGRSSVADLQSFPSTARSSRPCGPTRRGR
jgi:hypothetical protein